ncbi:MAG: 30S ribosomal protein S6 [Gemmatimonadetes bacterium]|jgi:small subunit ribosomal protein S6|nr:30S ribosomal protein S6 [Gemmatimonadota bacterium]MBT6148109.1 30S ribosomal protein S6 [Gemmatimonadota bacterium]MBT7860015.1 30S ribosomal protein S6 [Gemmatimonadota bacterium]
MVKRYELVLLIDPQIGESQIETTIDGYKQRLEEANAEVSHVDHWGQRKMAYTSAALQGRQQAFYVLFQFDAPPELIETLEAAMKLDEAVLRYLFISVDGEFLRVPQLAPENVYIYNPPERPRDRRGPRRDRDDERGREPRPDFATAGAPAAAAAPAAAEAEAGDGEAAAPAPAVAVSAAADDEGNGEK